MFRHHRPYSRSLAATLFGVLLLLASQPALGQSEEDKEQARQHYLKGKEAFDKGEYAAALTEYSEAYQRLALPGFLFNIGQCYRNLENLQEAINAYTLYLDKSPQAPNRPAVEKLIEDLKVKLKARAKPEPVPRPRPTPVPEKKPDDQVDVTDPDKPAGDAPVYKSENDAATSSFTDTRPKPEPSPPRARPFYKSWWFWTIVGVAVAGGAATGVYFGVRNNGPEIPGSTLGVADFSR